MSNPFNSSNKASFHKDKDTGKEGDILLEDTLPMSSLATLANGAPAAAAAEYEPPEGTWDGPVFEGPDGHGYFIGDVSVSEAEYRRNDIACRASWAAALAAASRSSSIVKMSVAGPLVSRKRPGPPLASASIKIGVLPPSFRGGAHSAPSQKPIVLNQSGGSGTTDDPFILSDDEGDSAIVVAAPVVLTPFQALKKRLLVSILPICTTHIYTPLY